MIDFGDLDSALGLGPVKVLIFGTHHHNKIFLNFEFEAAQLYVKLLMLRRHS